MEIEYAYVGRNIECIGPIDGFFEMNKISIFVFIIVCILYVRLTGFVYNTTVFVRCVCFGFPLYDHS